MGPARIDCVRLYGWEWCYVGESYRVLCSGGMCERFIMLVDGGSSVGFDVGAALGALRLKRSWLRMEIKPSMAVIRDTTVIRSWSSQRG